MMQNSSCPVNAQDQIAHDNQSNFESIFRWEVGTSYGEFINFNKQQYARKLIIGNC